MADLPQTAPGVVTTIAAKCRRCYNCVRSCPAKAIRVQGGQAQVLAERCIGCGNCIRVCAQQAKQVQEAIPPVLEMLAGESPVAALLAPSYPAAFPELSHGQVVAAVRALGFARVYEVAFGAEMVAREYARLFRRTPPGPLISTPCPALVSYVEKYLPELVPHLAPVVSPMIALGRAVKEQLLPGARTVFIGPCVAKKAEIADPAVAGAVDAALTFRELAQLLERQRVSADTLDPAEPDEPLPYLGALFPISGGLLKTAALEADLMDDSIAVVEGPDRCLAALHALRDGQLSGCFLDALLCEGCISGPAYNDDRPVLARKQILTNHLRRQRSGARRVQRDLRHLSRVSLSRGFAPQRLTLPQPTEKEIRDVLAQTNKLTVEQELNCGACGYPTCQDKAIAVCQGLAEPDMCLPYLIDQLEVNLERLGRSKGEIEKAREVALRAQQLASMGELAADIAGEISKPLGHLVVLAQLVRDGLPDSESRREDLAAIAAEALHCREMMSSLLGFASRREPQWQEVRLAEVVRHALQELAPLLEGTALTIRRSFAPDLPPLLADPQLLAQVLINVISNSIEASEGPGEITIEAGLVREGQWVRINVRDQGRGIPAELLPRLCQPFVTTKERGSGAGLGLPAAHGIVQSHGGEMEITSEPGRGTEVSIHLPLYTAPPQRREAVKVLVVDDDPDFLEQHRLMLEADGFTVVTAERGDEAVEVADREIPDAFVLDLMMERTDAGARLSRALRRDPRFREAPIIMLTSVVSEMGFEFSRNPEEVLDWMRADTWFDKPAPVGELTQTLRRLLEQRQEPQAGAAPAEEGGTPHGG